MARESKLEISEKVIKYETFLNDRLKSDLKSVLDCRNKLLSQIASYESLKTCIEKIKQTPAGEIKALSDLGCNFYCKAKVPDTCTSKIFVEVGLGFFVEFTLNEAYFFVTKKLKVLRGDYEVITEEATQINAKIRLVLEALNEIQFAKQD